MLEGILLRGKLIGSKINSFQRKDGTTGKSKSLSVLPNKGIETIVVEVPVDYEPEVLKDGRVEIPLSVPYAYCVSCKKFLRANLKIEQATA